MQRDAPVEPVPNKAERSQAVATWFAVAASAAALIVAIVGNQINKDNVEQVRNANAHQQQKDAEQAAEQSRANTERVQWWVVNNVLTIENKGKIPVLYPYAWDFFEKVPTGIQPRIRVTRILPPCSRVSIRIDSKQQVAAIAFMNSEGRWYLLGNGKSEPMSSAALDQYGSDLLQDDADRLEQPYVAVSDC
ncbi:hypothetical protein B0E54_00005 [Micromonospora sp. MH99]|nr:hypothetical protein [Micromonospora sp. MH99]